MNRHAHPFPDVVELLRALLRNDVDFVVIGGIAVVQHGFSRTTGDLDIVPQPNSANIDRLWAALGELEAHPGERDSLAQGGSWQLETRYGLLHILQHVTGKVESADDYARLRERADPIRYDFGTVRFVGYSDLMDLKYLAGREQDMIDIRALEEARGTAGPES